MSETDSAAPGAVPPWQAQAMADQAAAAAQHAADAPQVGQVAPDSPLATAAARGDLTQGADKVGAQERDLRAGADAAMAGVQRGPTLPAEDQMDQLMQLLRQQAAQIEAMQKRMGVMGAQVQAYQEQTGGAPVLRYAQAVQDKLGSHRVAHPMLGAEHFDTPTDLAGQLVDGAKAMLDNGAGPDAIEKAAAGLERWITRTHRRQLTAGTHVDWSALMDDLDIAVEEAHKLAAAA